MIWEKPWLLCEGFLIGVGLIIMGLMLQLSIGPIDWSLFAWPVNIMVLAALLLVVVGVFMLRRKVYAFQFLGTYGAAVPALVCAAVLTVIMGLTRQEAVGTWLHNMLTFWPFVLLYTYIVLILGLVILKQARMVVANCSLFTFNSQFSILNSQSSILHSPFSILSHLGLFLALTTATLGNADMQRLQMWTTNNPTMANMFSETEAFHQYEHFAMDENGRKVELPMAVELKHFIRELYADSVTPKRYASEVIIYPKASTHQFAATIDVNHPVEVEGWKIYQKDYRLTELGNDCQISIFELVSDPWLPWVYAGIFMMLGGAACLMLLSIPWTKGWRQTKKHPRRALSIGLLLAATFVCVHHFMPILHSHTLVPALQSPWFVPHIIAYMLAYAVLGATFLMAVWMLLRPSKNLGGLDNLVYIGLAFMTFGMLFGALWAKEAWGHYWSWDPKETWAAATWLSYLTYIHYRRFPHNNPRVALWMLIACFVLLQMCWWGINYLSAAHGNSVHTYG